MYPYTIYQGPVLSIMDLYNDIQRLRVTLGSPLHKPNIQFMLIIVQAINVVS